MLSRGCESLTFCSAIVYNNDGGFKSLWDSICFDLFVCLLRIASDEFLLATARMI